MTKVLIFFLLFIQISKTFVYLNDPKISDKYAWANSADPDQGLHCLPFRLHPLDLLLYGRAT